MGKRHIRFICECADADCLKSVPLTLTEFLQARTGGSRPVTVAGHARPPL